MKSLPLFWDGYGLGAKGSGVFVYGRKLAMNLAKIDVNPCLITTESWSQALPELDAAIIQERFVFRKFFESKPVWPLRTRFALEKFLRKSGANAVIHGLSNVNLSRRPAGSSRIKTVLTVHDLIPLIAPSMVSSLSAWQFRICFPWAVEAADRIVCVSEWTRRTLVEIFPSVSRKITMIPNGFDGLTSITAKQVSKGPLRLLCVARDEPYKNLALLQKIADLAGSRISIDLVTNRQLVMPGIRVHIGLHDQSLHNLYRSSDVYIHPSLYEGFCLPAAEALSMGIPVVYLGGTGIDEVAGSLVGFPVNRDAPASKWLERIYEAAESAKSSDFGIALVAWTSKLNSWSESALAIKSLYTELYESFTRH